MSDIDVSVIVPCYNTETYLDQCLTSIEANDSCSLEVIVLNDGSSDSSLDIMRAHAAADPRVRVVDKSNQGYGATVNRGIDEARGSYIAIVEPDDYLKPGMYDTLFDLARRTGMPDVVKSAYWRVWMPGTPDERLFRCAYYKRVRPVGEAFALAECPRLIMHHPSIWSALYRRDFLASHAIRFMEVPGAGWVDNPFLIETLAQAERIVYTDESFYCYREDLPESSTARQPSALAFERWEDMADVLDRLGVRDAGVRSALYTVGFRHAGLAIGRGDLADPVLRRKIEHMFGRMDPGLVSELPAVPAGLKRTFCSLRGIEPCKVSNLRYLAYLIGESVHGLRTNGLGFVCAHARIVLHRRSERGRSMSASDDA